jgi:hypothetical protein
MIALNRLPDFYSRLPTGMLGYRVSCEVTSDLAVKVILCCLCCVNRSMDSSTLVQAFPRMVQGLTQEGWENLLITIYPKFLISLFIDVVPLDSTIYILDKFFCHSDRSLTIAQAAGLTDSEYIRWIQDKLHEFTNKFKPPPPQYCKIKESKIPGKSASQPTSAATTPLATPVANSGTSISSLGGSSNSTSGAINIGGSSLSTGTSSSTASNGRSDSVDLLTFPPSPPKSSALSAVTALAALPSDANGAHWDPFSHLPSDTSPTISSTAALTSSTAPSIHGHHTAAPSSSTLALPTNSLTNPSIMIRSPFTPETSPHASPSASPSAAVVGGDPFFFTSHPHAHVNPTSPAHGAPSPAITTPIQPQQVHQPHQQHHPSLLVPPTASPPSTSSTTTSTASPGLHTQWDAFDSLLSTSSLSSTHSSHATTTSTATSLSQPPSTSTSPTLHVPGGLSLDTQLSGGKDTKPLVVIDDVIGGGGGGVVIDKTEEAKEGMRREQKELETTKDFTRMDSSLVEAIMICLDLALSQSPPDPDALANNEYTGMCILILSSFFYLFLDDANE